MLFVGIFQSWLFLLFWIVCVLCLQIWESLYLYCTFLSCFYFSILFVLLTSPEIPIILKVILLHFLIPPNQVYMWQTISLLCPHSWRFNHFTVSVISSASEFRRKPASQLHFQKTGLGPWGYFARSYRELIYIGVYISAPLS